MRRAYAGDPQGLVKLGRGDVGEIAERMAVLAWLADDAKDADQLRDIAITTKLELLKAELAGQEPSPIERLLAERAAVCWLRMNEAEVLLSTKGLTWKQIVLVTRRLDSAHSRFLSALKALATVQKRALPSVTFIGQQNNAGQQVVGDVQR